MIPSVGAVTSPTSPTSPTAPAGTTPPGTRVTLRLLQVVVVVHLLVTLAQPVLAGLYLDGDVDAIAVHAFLGAMLATVAMVMVAAALAHSVAVRGRWWLPVAATALFLADGYQIGAGYERTLALHVPLGVGILLASVALTWAVRR